jgi:hypothetical protein
MDSIGIYLDKIYVPGTLFTPITNKPNGLLSKVLLWYLNFSIDINSEITFISILISAVIVPQILSFLISGLFGCGMPPILVSKITKFAILSIIKFLCVLSALNMAQFIYWMYIVPPKNFGYFFDLGTYSTMALCLLLLASSFSLSVLYSLSGSALKYISDRGVTKNLSVAWAYMTRFADRN